MKKHNQQIGKVALSDLCEQIVLVIGNSHSVFSAVANLTPRILLLLQYCKKC